MPKYFLHLRDGVDEVLDEDGVERDSPAALYDTMLKAARDIIGHEARTGLIELHARIDAVDESGAVVLTLPFVEAVTIK